MAETENEVETRALSGAEKRHPKALWYLAFSESWERFSYYGMQTLLVLYMANHLLVGERHNDIAGFRTFRSTVEAITGELSTTALASLIFGLYTSTVYLTPIIGGAIADRFFGRTRTIIFGALIMVLGHFLMAFEASFLIALVCIAIGTGCFKGNIASQVGSLYLTDDPARSRAFQIFYLGISLGAIGSPLVCGTLGELYGWEWGFGSAGIGMLIGLAIYLAGRHHLPKETGAARHSNAPKSTSGERKDLLKAAVFLPVLAILVVPNQQIFNAYLLWAQDAYNFEFAGRIVPTSWLISMDAAASVIFLALSVWFWKWWGQNHREPDDFLKIAASGALTAAAFALLAMLAGVDDGKNISLGWAILFHCLNNLAFANMVPVGLSLFTRLSPASFGATAVGIYYLHLFVANNLVGWIGGYLDKMPAQSFWILHSLIAIAGIGLIIIVRYFLQEGRVASDDGANTAKSDGKP